nr:hypothetical protein [Belliella kenyensis]
MKDSAKIGERVPYVLKAKYSKGMNIIFPDSLYDYSPFVLLEKQTFMSQTRGDYTIDSAVYYVSNFSLDPTSTLSLPVFDIMKYDSASYQSDESSLALILTINPLPDQLAFKDNNIYQEIPKTFNFPLFLAVIVSLIVISTIILVIFGKSISKAFKNYREKRKYHRFIKKWKNAEARFVSNPNMNSADELLGLWKTYMEHLNDKPFREWTTVEIAHFLDNKEIIKDFREIEMIIYAGKQSIDVSQAVHNLKEICADTYQQKIILKDERK